MPIEYITRALCDKCHCVLAHHETTTREKVDTALRGWRRRWSYTGVMETLPNRYGKKKLYCTQCAG